MTGTRRGRVAALVVATLLAVMSLPDPAAADDTSTQQPPTGVLSTTSPTPDPTETSSDTTTATPTDGEGPPSTDEVPVICAPTPPPGVIDSSTVPETTPPAEPAAPSASPGNPTCGTVPPPDEPVLGEPESIQDIGQSFPGAAADSSEDATVNLVKEVPAAHPTTRALLQEKTPLPESMGGFFGEKPWTLPDTDATVKLDVTREGKIKKGHAAGAGLREYDGGEPGTRTVFQQLPGQSMRIYKIIERHETDAGAPTELRLRFERGCSGGWFSSTPKKCSKEQHCTRFARWIHRPCTHEWVLSNTYSYLGTKGITLIDPNTPSDVISDGTPRGFLTAPVARDASQRPVFVTWGINDDTVEVKVYDGAAGVKYPVVVDPQWFIGRWLTRGALVAGNPNVAVALMAIGCAARGAVEWPETLGQPWYRRVWQAALACLVAL